jgi:hypothetical protein
MIKMIATTISNSINEKPFCLLLIFPILLAPDERGRNSRHVVRFAVL